MCGKFAARASWREVTNYLEAMKGASLAAAGEGEDRDVSYRVMSALPVIVWDKTLGLRRIVPMRWGFPARDDPRRPDPVHARAETIDEKPTFRGAFLDGQRGIVLARNFNEAPDVPGPTVQHTITPGKETVIGIAFLWRRFGDLVACVMVTVPANELIATLPTDRMPAILANEDWGTWLGETGTPADAKACLVTRAGSDWRMNLEQRAQKPRRRPTTSDPGGLF